MLSHASLGNLTYYLNLIYHKKIVENHTTLPVQIIQSDDASENKAREIVVECRKTGTLLQQSQGGDQAQNGFKKRECQKADCGHVVKNQKCWMV